MTAAPGHSTLRALRALARPGRRCQRCLVFLGVLLPVPVFAASGLSVPLPATVERLAAALVPFADAATLEGNQALTRGARGLIVDVPGGRAADQSRDTDRISPESAKAGSDRPGAPGKRGGSKPEAESGSAPAAGGGRRATEDRDSGKDPDAGNPSPAPGSGSTDHRDEPTSGRGSEDPAPPNPGPGDPGDPGGAPGVVEDTVRQVDETVDPVTDEVDRTLDDVLEDPGNVGETVDEILPGLGT